MYEPTVNVAEALRARDFFGYSLRFGVLDTERKRVQSVVTGFTEQNIKPYEPIPQEAYLHVDHEAMQSLMDSLWDLGIRPKKFTGEQSALLQEAKQAHLDDMRQVALAMIQRGA